MDITGNDNELLRAISDPSFCVSAVTYKALQEKLMGSDWAKGSTGKKLASILSRSILLLHSHGLLRKLPKRHKYVLTDKGRKITTVLNALLAASTEGLVKLVA